MGETGGRMKSEIKQAKDEGTRGRVGRPPKLGTLRWKICTTEATKAELTRRAQERGLTPGDVLSELVTGLIDYDAKLVCALISQAKHEILRWGPRDRLDLASCRRLAGLEELERKLVRDKPKSG